MSTPIIATSQDGWYNSTKVIVRMKDGTEEYFSNRFDVWQQDGKTHLTIYDEDENEIQTEEKLNELGIVAFKITGEVDETYKFDPKKAFDKDPVGSPADDW